MAYIDALPAISTPDQAAAVPVSCPEEERLLSRFVAENGDLYVATFHKMLARDPSLRTIVFEWNWAAFLLACPWALYRKMWTFLAAVTFGPLLAETVLFGHRVPVLDLAIAILVGAVSKSLYVKSAVRRIRALRARGLSDEELLALIDDKGRSRAGWVVGMILTTVATYIAFGAAFSSMHQ